MIHFPFSTLLIVYEELLNRYLDSQVWNISNFYDKNAVYHKLDFLTSSWISEKQKWDLKNNHQSLDASDLEIP